jgi:hypothetical protein
MGGTLDAENDVVDFVPTFQAGKFFAMRYPDLRSPTRSSLGYHMKGFQPKVNCYS